MDLVSVLVCTRHRADSLVRTVRSLLRDDASPFELIVLDQSEGPESERALAAFADDRRLRYVRSLATGKGAALNEGLRMATGEIVVCTDDDCEAPPGWVAAMAAAIAEQPRTALLFCNVTTPPYDSSTGYIPAYERQSDRRLVSMLDARTGIGLGAGMALRRTAILALRGFDESFGPGSRFGSGDDWDLSLRLLLKGWHVYDTSRVSIVHHGFRTFAEGRTHATRDWVAIGALCAKPVRAGYPSGVILSAWLFTVMGLWPPVYDVLRLRRPSGFARIAGFVKGFARGMRTRVERDTMRFAGARTGARDSSLCDAAQRALRQ